MKYVYILQWWDDENDANVVGVFSSKKKARSALFDKVNHDMEFMGELVKEQYGEDWTTRIRVYVESLSGEIYATKGSCIEALRYFKVDQHILQ